MSTAMSPADMAKTATDSTTTDATNKAATKASGTASDTSSKPAVILTTAAQQSTASTSVTQVQALCDQFLKVRNGNKLTQLVSGQEETYAHRSIKALGNLLNYIWANQNDIQVIETFRKFMVANRNGQLSCENALQGMNYVNSEMLRNRYSLMYMLMFELTNPTRTRTSYDYINASKACNNPACANPNGYVVYVQSRMA